MKEKVSVLEVLIIGGIFINYHAVVMESEEIKMWSVLCGVFYFASKEVVSLYKKRSK